MVIETFSASIHPVEGEILLQEKKSTSSSSSRCCRPVKMINDDISVNTLANSKPRVAIDGAEAVDGGGLGPV